MFSKGQLSHTRPYTYGPRLQHCKKNWLTKDPSSSIADKGVINIEKISGEEKTWYKEPWLGTRN